MKKFGIDIIKKYRKCDKCGRTWNVPHNVLKQDEYLCPHCSSKERKGYGYKPFVRKCFNVGESWLKG